MRAMAMKEYGGPEKLRPVDVPRPKVGPDSVLVRVRTAGVNPVDWKIAQGRMDEVARVHFPLVPGWDLAGVVEELGPAVVEYAVGDEVIGYVREDHVQNGTYAELVAAPVRTLADKPASLDWPQAGGLPLAGLAAFQCLAAAGVGLGDTVVVHGASGGVGSFAVQIAVAHGARVIGTASPGNHDYLRSLGAVPVAYGEGLVERVREVTPEGVDAAVDFVGGDAVAASVALVGASRRDEPRIASIVDVGVKKVGGRYVFAQPSYADLTSLGNLADAHKLSVHVTRTFPLEEAAEALRLSQQGHTRGKIVLEVS
ncbi:alcohol dehydrogenase [Wenjunlia vitaminophila]|uniref:Alcohol dehydrogenase n=1 Tax=Wenjunlia vitaminophila TaxID=76728 RepID=A0A0T6LZ48_WENVI|nr:NADP-dependent oxidoreductase [Wenjunlia vitaminophila]KRV51232.1 alcohol dehydrogenase [Wenjunlia vitaminophila]